jgi:hypothetical protein
VTFSLLAIATLAAAATTDASTIRVDAFMRG